MRTLVTLFTCKSKEKILIKQEKNGKSESCSKKELFANRPNLLTSLLKTPVFIGDLGTVGVSRHLTHTYRPTSEIKSHRFHRKHRFLAEPITASTEERCSHAKQTPIHAKPLREKGRYFLGWRTSLWGRKDATFRDEGRAFEGERASLSYFWRPPKESLAYAKRNFGGRQKKVGRSLKTKFDFMIHYLFRMRPQNEPTLMQCKGNTFCWIYQIIPVLFILTCKIFANPCLWDRKHWK